MYTKVYYLSIFVSLELQQTQALYSFPVSKF